MREPAADFAKMRAALVAFTRQACELGQNQVVIQNSGDPIAQRPLRPFCALRIQSPAMAKGRGFSRHAGAYGDKYGVFDYYQQMAMVVAWDFFADAQDDAYALAHGLQFGLEVPPLYDVLRAAGLAVWQVNQVEDLSALINTGYEARTHLTVQLGYMAHKQVDVGVIDGLSVNAVVTDGKDKLASFALTADL